MPSPCPCRGCKAAYEAGLTDQQWAVHAYEQGREHGYKHGYDDGMTAGYREGYNDHARSRAYAEQVYGPYKPNLAQVRGGGQVSRTDGDGVISVNQHGKGENP